ncbi:FAD-dependent monooxygenase [Nocardia arthritidis]|uniref:FAD-dependent oxidoreductase n=1 Tax=Nocardia arthritidis TaxID=228602 RepID=A0A6G9YIX9_9NOCA|nr:FAD-dependent monooxygenase [Nocardia arthritidis]QIS13162.1 FAD-dependent oxidoreductase [Nocardia arthritidis]
MSENRTDVVISGAGPNGLMLACELARAGIRPIVLERLAGPSGEPKANGLVGPVARVLDMRGLYTAWGGLSDGPQPMPGFVFGALRMDFTDLDPNPLTGLLVSQPELIEKLLALAAELEVDIRWGHEVTGLRQDGDDVLVTVTTPDGPLELATRYLVGADGGKSTVRKLTGIEFPGSTNDSHISRIGHVTMPDELRTADGGIEIPGAGRFQPAHNRVERGMFIFAQMPTGTLMGVMEHGAEPVDEQAPMDFQELRDAIERVLGVPVPIEPPTGPGPFALRRIVGQNTRVAQEYRVGNIFLIGDAAHVHSAIGGPGLNLGLQDAFNLGWKLAAQLNGWAPDGLLDTYQAERRRSAERTAMQSLSQSVLVSPGPEITALRQLFGELLRNPDNVAYIANLMAGADIRYDTGDEHRVSGYLVPDFRLDTGQRVAELLHSARPVLLNLTGEPWSEHLDGWTDRIDLVNAISPDAPAAALLIRPDGYVAWATDSPVHPDDPGLRAALNRWFGPARSLAPVR